MWYFLLGCVTISISGLSIDLLLKSLHDKEISIRNITRKSRTQMQLTIPNKSYKDFKEAAQKHKADTKIVRRQGILFRILSLLGRPVLSAGLVAILIFSIAGNWFVTDLDYNVLADEETMEELKDNCRRLGIYQGAFKRNWDVDKLEIEIYKAMKDIVYVSIKIDGSFVEIEAVEKTASDSDRKRNVPSNVIAEKACVIQEILLYNGYSVIEVGDVVEKGQLLVSAIVPSKDGSESMIVGAAADIKGRVWYTGTHKSFLYDIISKQTGNIDKSFKIIFGEKTIIETYSKLDLYQTEAYEYVIMQNILPIKIVVNKNKEIVNETIELDLEDVIYLTEAMAIEAAVKQIDEEAIILNTSVESKVEDGKVFAQAIVETSELISIRVLINNRE